MLIDGNDARGIDVGEYVVNSRLPPCAAISTPLPGGRIFSRDCAEYEIDIPGSTSLWLLNQSFQEQRLRRSRATSKPARCKPQRTAQIYAKRHKRHKYVAVLGDFNDTPDSDALSPLLKDTDLKDVMTHASYTGKPGTRPGTFGTGSASNKIDYILLSPACY